MADVISVRAKPGSRKGPLVEIGGEGELTVYLREPAAEGKANRAVVNCLPRIWALRPADWI